MYAFSWEKIYCYQNSLNASATWISQWLATSFSDLMFSQTLTDNLYYFSGSLPALLLLFLFSIVGMIDRKLLNAQIIVASFSSAVKYLPWYFVWKYRHENEAKCLIWKFLFAAGNLALFMGISFFFFFCLRFGSNLISSRRVIYLKV